MAVVADDLIWATRLAEAVRRAGADPVMVRSRPGVPPVLPLDGSLAGAIVDLFARGEDRSAVVRAAVGAGIPVIAVAEHDDQPTRQRARAAGAQRVYSYNKLHADGPRLVAAWLGREEESAS